jgi:hypothetical protein
MQTTAHELRRAGVAIARTKEGFELPVNDVTHPRFVLPGDTESIRILRDATLLSERQRRRLPKLSATSILFSCRAHSDAVCGAFVQRKRSRIAACLARFPQTAMLHHLRRWLFVLSTNIKVQLCPSQAFMCVKSSSQITLAISCAMGRSKLSGDRHRRSSCQTSPIFAEE